MDAFKKYIQPDGSILYWPYNKSQYTCDQAQAAVNALLANTTTDEQRLALFTTVQPAVPTDATGWRIRDCSAGSTINVNGDNSGYVPPSGTNPTTPTEPTDVDYDSQGDLVGFVTT